MIAACTSSRGFGSPKRKQDSEVMHSAAGMSFDATVMQSSLSDAIDSHRLYLHVSTAYGGRGSGEGALHHQERKAK